MAITIRNKQTEELIRKIGQRTGEGPSAIVRRLAEKEAARQPAQPDPQEIARRMKAIEELSRKCRPDPKPSWNEFQQEIDEINEIT